jgi:hypothetical protein
MKKYLVASRGREGSQLINPPRLFHAVWLPKWLEERPEVSEKAKKLYAYLTYFGAAKVTHGRLSIIWPKDSIFRAGM